MKVLKKSDGSVIGIFKVENAQAEVLALGYSVDECDFVKSQAELDRENLTYLESTDWLVTRHRDQVAMAVATSLTDDEYKALLERRQQAREQVVNQNALKEYRSIA